MVRLRLTPADRRSLRLRFSPNQPVKNDQQNPVTVSFMIGLNEAVKPGTVPEVGVSALRSGAKRDDDSDACPGPVRNRGMLRPGLARSRFPPMPARRKWKICSLFTGAWTISVISAPGSFVTIASRFTREICRHWMRRRGLPERRLREAGSSSTWNEVAGAAGYQLYRKGPGRRELSAYQRLGLALEFIDQTPAEGVYVYAIASIRLENGQEAVSGMSAPVQVTSDATAPLAPQNLKLQLIGQGVLATWQAPPEAEPMTYALYRADANEITSVVGMTPIFKGIRGVQALDAKPSLTDHCYVVTAVDEAGNESPPSNSAYLNFTLLPVASLKVVQNGMNPPVISWTHPGGDIAGYNLSLGSVKLNQGLLTALLSPIRVTREMSEATQ